MAMSYRGTKKMTDELFDELSSEMENVEQPKNVADELQQAVSEQSSESSNVFDYNDLPDSPNQKYDRVELDGQEITIAGAVIEMPQANAVWLPTKKNTGFTKRYGFKISYDTPNKDREYYSGLQGFKQDDGALSKPTIYAAGKNQASKLFKVYKDYVMKNNKITSEEFDEQYGLKQLMNFLNSKPKARMETQDVENDDEITRKNFIVEFL